LDYFFEPPAFSLWVVDRLNVVAIAAFLTTSLVITRQVSRLREMTDEALISIHRKLIDTEERERTRIARELHDDINQRISLVALDLAQLEETPSASVAELSSYIQKLLQRVSEIGADLHTISRGLHCFGLDILGIAASAKSYCVEFAQRQKVEIDFKSHDVPSPLDVPMYRLFTDDDHVKKPNIPTEDIQRRLVNAKQERELRAFAKFISRMGDKNRGLLFHMASKMANRA
jgi:signal transduction histidine kinase